MPPKKKWRKKAVIDKMTKYSFVLLSGEAESFLKELEELGVVDITRSEKPVDDRSATLSSDADAYGKAISYLEKLDLESDPDKDKVFVPDEIITDPLTAFQETSAKEKQIKSSIETARKESPGTTVQMIASLMA